MAELMLISGLLLAGFAVYLIVHNILSEDDDQKALFWATGDEPTKSSSKFLEFSRPLVHKFSLGLAAKVKNSDYRKNIAERIKTAGLEGELNVDEFIGLQMLWGVLFPLFLFIANFSLSLGYPTPLVIVMGLAGAYFPHMHCATERKKRYKSITLDLPFFIDLLALSTEAGLDFISALQRVSEKAPNSVLGQEIGKVLKDIKLGSSRSEALRKMADRLDMSEVTSFIVVLADADSTGANIGEVLKQQSAQMRLERFTRAEKAGAKASQMMLLPMVLFILPAIFLMVFGPVGLQFLSGGFQ